MKVIVMDMDGTLLNDDKKVTEYTKNVLRDMKKRGMRIGIASGRPIIGVKRTVENLGISDIIQFMIASNGAELFDVEDKEKKDFYKLDVDTIFEIIDEYEQFDLNPYVYQGEDCYAARNDSTIERAARNNHLGIHLCDMKKEVTTPQSKLVLSTPPEKMESVEKFYEEHKSEKYRAFKSQADMFEFVHPKLSKVYGIRYYCEKYGYDEQTALRNFTSSETCRMLKNPELEMWEFCPDIIFEMWECEQITGNPRNSIYIRSK